MLTELENASGLDMDREEFVEMFGDWFDFDNIEMNCQNRFLKTGPTDELAHPYFQGGYKYDFTGNSYEKITTVSESTLSMREKVVNLITAPHKVICREVKARLGYMLNKSRKAIYKVDAYNFLSPDKDGNFQWGTPVYHLTPLMIIRDWSYIEGVSQSFLEHHHLFQIAERMLLRHEKLDMEELAFIVKFGFGINSFQRCFGYELYDLKLFDPERCDLVKGLDGKARFCSTRRLKELRWKGKTPALYNFKLCAFKHVALTATNHVDMLNRTTFEKITSMDGYEPFNKDGNFFTLEFNHAGQARYSGQL